jgi:hypothetical protein
MLLASQAAGLEPIGDGQRLSSIQFGKPLMMKFARIATFTGIGLLVFAWLTAGFIPDQARHDFDRLVRAAGGSLSHTPTFPDTYIQMSANRRLLQNVYLAAAGLICLGVGLAAWKRYVEVIAAPSESPITPVDKPDFTKRPPSVS